MSLGFKSCLNICVRILKDIQSLAAFTVGLLFSWFLLVNHTICQLRATPWKLKCVVTEENISLILLKFLA